MNEILIVWMRKTMNVLVIHPIYFCSGRWIAGCSEGLLVWNRRCGLSLGYATHSVSVTGTFGFHPIIYYSEPQFLFGELKVPLFSDMWFGLTNPSLHQGYSYGGAGKTKWVSICKTLIRSKCACWHLISIVVKCKALFPLFLSNICKMATIQITRIMTFCYFVLNSQLSSHLWTCPTNQPICLYDAAGTFITLVTEKYKSKENMVCIFMNLLDICLIQNFSFIQGVWSQDNFTWCKWIKCT